MQCLVSEIAEKRSSHCDVTSSVPILLVKVATNISTPLIDTSCGLTGFVVDMQFLFNNRKIGADDQEREQSSSSIRTLANGSNGDEIVNEESREKADGGESGQDGLKEPVGFWHPSLSKTRLIVFGAWLRTGIVFLCLSFYSSRCIELMICSTDPLNLYPRDPVAVLGCIVQCGTKFELSDRFCGQL